MAMDFEFILTEQYVSWYIYVYFFRKSYYIKPLNIPNLPNPTQIWKFHHKSQWPKTEKNHQFNYLIQIKSTLYLH